MKTIYVAINGNDQADGSKATPFATLARAQQEVRKYVADMKEDITVWIGEGFYALNAPLRFGEQDSGQNGFTVLYRAEPDAKVVISGGEMPCPIEKRGNVSVFAGVDGAHTLYEDGRRCNEARFPKSGYLRNTVNEECVIGFSPDELPEIKDIKNLKVTVWPGGPEGHWNWFSNTIRVKEIDYATGKIHLTSPTAFECGAGSRYYLHGSPDLLTEPGEFCRASDADEVWVIRSREDSEVVIPVSSELVRCEGAHNLTFEGICFAYTDAMDEVIKVLPEYYEDVHDGAFWLEDCRDISIFNCDISNTGFHGVFMRWANERVQVRHCNITHTGHTGIQVQGIYRKGTSATKHHAFTDNRISYTGELIGHGAGIQIIQCSDTHIAHNEVSYTSRYGISIKGTAHTKMVGDEVVTVENLPEFSLSRNNVIEYNDVSHCNTDSQDTGMIESWGTGEGIIRGNHLHDSDIAFSWGFGIYLDDDSFGYLVEDNLLHDLQKHGKGELWNLVMTNCAKEHVIRNNVFINNNVSKGVIGSLVQLTEKPGIKLCEGNLMYNSGHPYFFHTYNDGRIGEADRNLIFTEDTDILLKINWEDEPEPIPMAKWQAEYGYDRNSIFEDPGIVETEDGFELKADGAAARNGFRLPDIKRAGVRPGKEEL